MFTFEMIHAVWSAFAFVAVVGFTWMVAFAHSMDKLQAVHLEALDKEIVRGDRHQHKNQELRAALLKAEQWKDVMLDQLTVDFLLNAENSDSPSQALVDLLTHHYKLALDPAVSRGANQLINKAKREHGKKIRAKHARELAKMAAEYERQAQVATGVRHRQSKALALSRAEFSFYQSLIVCTLEKYVPLASVRNAFIKYINEAHKRWQDTY